MHVCVSVYLFEGVFCVRVYMCMCVYVCVCMCVCVCVRQGVCYLHMCSIIFSNDT